ncbi:hypothetical protein F4692_001492 [Nocardioides cavernae]|uniref:CBM6 domain-containing protein n=1 Tax=Nocardioides cavernae TaxID=1921566 RepID=A0A7Y9KT15_9ACTN|nr:family 16 glycoside hydrolase [Nocardioides cavernae]NYE36388.1 hypothetical protein [Nocardioides cavernae]
MSLPLTHRLRRLATAVTALAVAGVGALAAVPAPAGAAVGDEQVAWLEVEDGAISGGPALNSGDHGNFSGTGSYTFRETGMTSAMTFQAPAAGTYPVWIRYAAGPLSAEENVTRAMGLLTNGGSRQSVSYPLTGSWESWAWAPATVTLQQGTNTLTVQCDRAVEMCRLNFDAIQVGGTAPDTCAPTPVAPGATRLFDGTFASFDQWRKAGAGGFGHQTDCTIRGFRGRGATWTTAEQTGPYTLGVDWRRADAKAASSVYVASSTNTSADPTGGYQVRIGASDTGAITYGGTTQPADATAVAAAVDPVGSWNHFDVQLTPRRIRVLLNGVAVNVVDRTAATAGHIGLENRAVTADVTDQVSFRDIQVTPTVVLGELAGPARRATGAGGGQGAESTLAHLVADSQRWATRGAAGGTARIALVSPTSLQADLVPSGGDVTYAQAAAAVADEPLVNRRLTGAQLKAVLEQQWQRTADDAVATPAFRRLGASTGFTWTEDATRPEGDRVTGMWLDGVAILPTGTYSVTASRSLADGGDNFRAFDVGVERLPDASTRSAFAAYLADVSAGGAVALPATQRAVDVHVPGGTTTYPAGTTYAVDLRSWSYSHPTDPVDTVVDVSIGGRPAGSFAVTESGDDDDPYDQRGAVAVRAVVPVGLPTAPTTVTIVGRTTGTTVRLPIDVVAAPTTPTPDPTPDPTPAPTPTPVPVVAPSPSALKATARIGVKVRPGRIVARRTRATLVVTVRSSGATPTGTVTAQVGRRTVQGTVRRGKAVLTLPKLPRPRATRVTVTYSGDAGTLSTSRTLQVRAVAP